MKGISPILKRVSSLLKLSFGRRHLRCPQTTSTAHRIFRHQHVTISSTTSTINFRNNHENQSFRALGAVGAGLFLAGSGVMYNSQKQPVQAQTFKAGQKKPGLPSFTPDQVREHDSRERRIYVSYGEGVYDITDFIPKHPGEEKILMGAGGSLEPFWKMYGMHNTDEIHRLLEEYRVGNLYVSEEEKKKKARNENDPYANDPVDRHPALKVHSQAPFIAETTSQFLGDSFLTPNALFYVRHHHPVPLIEEDDYELTIEGLSVPGDEEGVTLTLTDLRSMPQISVVTTIQCGGNRRSELVEATGKSIKGSKWKMGALGNAEWTGVPLRYVLQHIGVNIDDPDPSIKHVHFEGLDWGADSPYGASIPIEKALNPIGDVILALKMNGEDLPRDHGFPVRAIVPGVVGARNVKWVGRIELSDEEYNGHFQRKAYKTFNPSQGWDGLDWSQYESIQEMPVQSGITFPREDTKISRFQNTVHVQGVAWSGGGRGVIRVDVSLDGGETWVHANLSRPNQKRYQEWAWTLWEVDIPLPKGQKELNIVCKAVDTSHNVQPDSAKGVFNLRGYTANHWHRVNVPVV